MVTAGRTDRQTRPGETRPRAHVLFLQGPSCRSPLVLPPPTAGLGGSAGDPNSEIAAPRRPGAVEAGDAPLPRFPPGLQRRGGSPTSTKVPITLSLAANVFLYQPCASLYNVDHFDGAFVLISQMRKQSCKYCAVIKMAIYCAAFWLLPAQNLISIPLPPSLCSSLSCDSASSFTLAPLAPTPAWPAIRSQSTSTPASPAALVPLC